MPLTNDDFIRMINLLRESNLLIGDQWYVQIHPDIWNGHWYVQKTIPFFRWLGRKLHNKYIYWLGFQVRWVMGLKEFYEKEIKYE